MFTRAEPKHAAQSSDADYDVTDGGWDPYVTSLMLGAVSQKALPADDEDEAVPVMSFSSTEAKRRR